MFATVKWFNDQKGYGFLVPQTGGKDVFVHISALMKSKLTTLKEGQKVEFDLQMGKKGDEAVNVRLV